MVTLITILAIVFVVCMSRRAYKQGEIMEGTRSQLLEKREGRLYLWGVMLVISILALVISYFVIDNFYETEYTTTTQVWLIGDVETKHNTSAGNWSLFLSIFGWIMGPLSVYWFFSNLEKYLKYKNMSDNEFCQLQVETKRKYEDEQQAMKTFNKAGKVVKKGMGMFDSFDD